MGQELLDRDVLQPAIGRRAVAAEEAGQRRRAAGVVKASLPSRISVAMQTPVIGFDMLPISDGACGSAL